MEEGRFTLHKWHSNVKHLEDNNKQQGTLKILGVTWDKANDLFQMDLKAGLSLDPSLTKRKMLGVINGIFDILGWVSPVVIKARLLFSVLCLKGVTWDEFVP